MYSRKIQFLNRKKLHGMGLTCRFCSATEKVSEIEYIAKETNQNRAEEGNP